MNRRRTTSLPFFALVAVLIVVIAGGSFALNHTGERVETCTVVDKDRTTNHEGKSSMRVYTEECGVVQVRDMVVRAQFDSADTYAKIEVGQTYRFTLIGRRVPILSMFPTIVAVEEVEP